IVYSWSPVNGLSNATVANPTASPGNTMVYYVTVTDTNQCVATDSVTVTVNPLPIVTISPDTVICLGASTQITSGDGIYYAWTPSNGLSSSAISNPVASPSITTTYSVTVTNSSGCSGTAAVKVTVYPPPNVKASADTGICTGGNIQITASGGNQYMWVPAA